MAKITMEDLERMAAARSQDHLTLCEVHAKVCSIIAHGADLQGVVSELARMCRVAEEKEDAIFRRMDALEGK